jgi:ubiquinone/menaquinone biosynthesis C-methylase UbiE
LDVGVGTGYFLAAMHKSEQQRHPTASGEVIWPQTLTLIDLNPTCLETAARHLGHPDRTECVMADAREPLPIKPGKFDSISFMYLLHCIPAPPEKKGCVFANLKLYLEEPGTLFSVTILGRGVRHN